MPVRAHAFHGPRCPVPPLLPAGHRRLGAGSEAVASSAAGAALASGVLLRRRAGCGRLQAPSGAAVVRLATDTNPSRDWRLNSGRTVRT